MENGTEKTEKAERSESNNTSAQPGTGIAVGPSTVECPPLIRFNELRKPVLKDVVSRTRLEFESSNLDLLLGEALYLERARLKREHATLHTYWRKRKDRRFWGKIHKELLKPAAIANRKIMLADVLDYYSEEIGAHFDPRVYRFAAWAAPNLLNRLLNSSIDDPCHKTNPVPVTAADFRALYQEVI